MTNYGKKRSIFVEDVCYPTDSENEVHVVDAKGAMKTYTIHQYFKSIYGIQLEYHWMPFFVTTRGFKRRFIPVEKCELDGLDDETRNNH